MAKSTQEFGSSTLNSPTQTPKNLVYQDVLKQVREFQGKALLTSLSSPQVVGDYGRWQVKVVLLLWIPMFFCGTQFVTTDLMNMEPKVLFCKASATCTSYDTIFLPNSRSVCFTFLSHDCSKILIFSGSRRAEHIEENLAYYRKIFPEITDHFRQDNLAVTKMVGLKV